jgi:hypothetical protein
MQVAVVVVQMEPRLELVVLAAVVRVDSAQ